MNGHRVAAHHSPHIGTMLKLTTGEHTSLSASGGSGGGKKKVNLSWRSCRKVAHHSRVCEEALLHVHWLTGSVTLVSGLRLNANCPFRTVCFVANLDELLYMT